MVEEITLLLKEKDLKYEDIKNYLKEKDETLYYQLKKDDSILTNTLNELIKKGIIIITRKNKYKLVSNTELIKSRIKIKNNKGVIYYNNSEITIKDFNLNNAKDKDTVLFSYDKETMQGRVYSIIESYNPSFTSEVIIKDNIRYVKFKNKYYKLISNDLNSITSGYIVLAKLEKNNAILIEKIGHKDEIDDDIIPLMYEYGFNNKFTKEVTEEAKELYKYLSNDVISNLIQNHNFLDLRDETIFTIDSETTNDIDDAISFKPNKDQTFTLITSIALPAYIIKKDGYIYQDIINRATSVYPIGTAIHMNHQILSKDVCSLNENSDRLSISYIITYDNNCNRKNIDIKLSIIRSKKKMTYTDVNKILKENIIPEGYEPYVEMLKQMNGFAKKLKRKMEKEGFIDFDSYDIKVKRDKEKRILEKNINDEAENLIEFFMLTTNEEVTKELNRLGLKIIYRVCDKPNDIKLNKTMKFLSNKIDIKEKEYYSSSDIKKCIKLLKNNEVTKKIYNDLLIRCMSLARFSTINTSHYPTGKKIYAMHTSPMRRAEDFINQMIILDYMKYGVEKTNMLWNGELEDLASHFNEKEKNAELLEQKALKKEMAKQLKQNIGKTYQGIITNVTEYGFYVLIEDIYEGLVGIRSLNAKTKYLEEEFSILDKTNNITYTVGDKVNVIISNINDNDEIDLVLIDNSLEKNNIKKRVKK